MVLVTLRYLTAADMRSFVPSLPYRLLGIAGVDPNGDLLGVGGLAYLPDGRVFAFSHFGQEAAKYPVALHKAALRVIALAKVAGVRELYAAPDLGRSQASKRWLMRLGFKECQEGWWVKDVRA